MRLLPEDLRVGDLVLRDGGWRKVTSVQPGAFPGEWWVHWYHDYYGHLSSGVGVGRRVLARRPCPYCAPDEPCAIHQPTATGPLS